MKKGIEKANLDTAVKPGEDFYEYATGGWNKANPLKPEYSRYGMFDKLAEESKEKLRDLVEHIGETPEAKIKDSEAQKVADLFRLASDMERRNRDGVEPIREALRKIEESDIKGDQALFEAQRFIDANGSFVNVGVGADPDNADMNILHIGTAGTTLGDRDYYLVKSETNDKILEAFRRYVITIMGLAGYDAERCARIWNATIEIETEIARNQRTREENRNPEVRHNITDIEHLKGDYPDFDWDTYFNTIGLDPNGRINKMHPEFITFITNYIKELPEEKIKDYTLFCEVNNYSGVLSEDFENADFEFSKVISGAEKQHPRWRKALNLTSGMLTTPVGKLYTDRFFPEESKAAAVKLVEGLRKALGEHIEALTWMSDATKASALTKLKGMRVKIGYPDKWQDFSQVHVDPEKTLAANIKDMQAYWKNYGLSKLWKPVDKEEWYMPAYAVNAYYAPTNNEICFPAGILQPPYFDTTADDALNYGAIGAVIGHEMTHGFDDSGRKFDAKGNLNDWWDANDAEAFNKLTDRLVAQFDAIEVAPGTHANGRFTLGENIADQGGLRLAMTAYRNSLKETDPEHPEGETIDGFTPEQRFYLSYASVWAGNIRPEAILQRTQTDPHSLGRYRVNVTLRNIDTFFEAFDIKEGDTMWRPEEERVIIW